MKLREQIDFVVVMLILFGGWAVLLFGGGLVLWELLKQKPHR